MPGSNSAPVEKPAKKAPAKKPAAKKAEPIVAPNEGDVKVVDANAEDDSTEEGS